ncbi:MAG TPA: hypothetical protein DCS93_21275 [Microscillaceae bacterium]|nr:hypothetical protein [Microscillaceae bacterium]
MNNRTEAEKVIALIESNDEKNISLGLQLMRSLHLQDEIDHIFNQETLLRLPETTLLSKESTWLHYSKGEYQEKRLGFNYVVTRHLLNLSHTNYSVSKQRAILHTIVYFISDFMERPAPSFKNSLETSAKYQHGAVSLAFKWIVDNAEKLFLERLLDFFEEEKKMANKPSKIYIPRNLRKKPDRFILHQRSWEYVAHNFRSFNLYHSYQIQAYSKSDHYKISFFANFGI